MAKGELAAILELRRGRRLVVLTMMAMVAGLLVFPGVAAAAPDPTSVTVAGSLQGELGCPGDWQPDCTATHLTYDGTDGVWQGVFAVPAGSWEYKAALNDSWDENYGANAQLNGANIGLLLASDTDVKFYYDHETHWITDSQNSVIATAVGSFQSELGCSGDWQPDCLRSWLQDPDGDGTYLFSTTAIPAGSYEVKVAINESWDENYGAGAVPNGANIPFTVGTGQTVWFFYDAATHILTIEVLSPNTPPVADANGPYLWILGVPVSFDGTGSYDPENGVLTFDWDFGDGSSPVIDAGPTPTHTYATAAAYTVLLTVTDAGGLTDTATTTATITSGSESFDVVETTIEGLGLESAGFENSLLKKIQNAQKSFDKADGEVCEKLASFIAAVNAQDGKKLTPEQADLLRSQAEAIGDAYGCDT